MSHWMATSVFFGGVGFVGSATVEEVHVYLLPSGNLKAAVNSEQAGGLGISVHVVSITDVECGDSMWLSGVAVITVVEYMTVGGLLQEGVTEGSDNFLETGGGDFTGVTCVNRYSKVISLGRPPVTTFLTGEKSRASPEGSARKTFLCGSRSTSLCSQASYRMSNSLFCAKVGVPIPLWAQVNGEASSGTRPTSPRVL